MIQISGGKSALWWEQKRQMSGGKCDKLGGGKSDKGKWYIAEWNGNPQLFEKGSRRNELLKLNEHWCQIGTSH